MKYSALDYVKDSVKRQLPIDDPTRANILCFKILKKPSDETLNKNPDKKIKLDQFYFASALRYILLGQEMVKGQGDLCEGMLARFAKSNSSLNENIERLQKRFTNDQLFFRKQGDFVEVFRKHTFSVPIGCFFNATGDLTNMDDNRITLSIPVTLFADFFDADLQEIDIGEFEIINYLSSRTLYSCLIDSLNLYGVKAEDLTITPINYSRTPDIEWECPYYDASSSRIPLELLYKDSCFKHQQESRVLINSDKFRIITGQIVYDTVNEEFSIDNWDTLQKAIKIPMQERFKTSSGIKLRRNEYLKIKITLKSNSDQYRFLGI